MIHCSYQHSFLHHWNPGNLWCHYNAMKHRYSCHHYNGTESQCILWDSRIHLLRQCNLFGHHISERDWYICHQCTGIHPLRSLVAGNQANVLVGKRHFWADQIYRCYDINYIMNAKKPMIIISARSTGYNMVTNFTNRKGYQCKCCKLFLVSCLFESQSSENCNNSGWFYI